MNCPKCGTRSNTADARYCPDCGAAFGGPAAPAGPYTVSSAALALSPSPPPCDNPPYSGFWRRVGAYIIDDILIIIGYSIVSFAVASFMIGAGASSKSAARSMVAWVWLVLVVAPWLYCAFMESSNLQATVGKLALGIKVTGQDGERIGFGQATGRYFSHLLTAISFGVGYAMVVFTSRRQALHDMVARTYVVRRQFSAEEVGAAGPAPPAPVWMTVLAVCACVGGGPFGIGILAAIAVPAYQDYTIRSQVVEGLNAVAPYKAAVAKALADGRSAREINSRTLDLSSPEGLRYVREVTVESGVVIILYGKSAHRSLIGESLAIAPGRTSAQSRDSLVWVCGRHRPPSGTAMVSESAERQTSVADKFLPRSCRAGGGCEPPARGRYFFAGPFIDHTAPNGSLTVPKRSPQNMF
jgi:uncharacterized RDD family membrane protein YckC